MVKRAKALELAGLIENNLAGAGDMEIAAELRRLHAENDGLLASRGNLGAAIERQYFSAELLADRVMRLEAQRDELLEALQSYMAGIEAMGWNTDKAKAAIANATGDQQ